MPKMGSPTGVVSTGRAEANYPSSTDSHNQAATTPQALSKPALPMVAAWPDLPGGQADSFERAKAAWLNEIKNDKKLPRHARRVAAAIARQFDREKFLRAGELIATIDGVIFRACWVRQ